jgi:hypothetical protein
MTDPVLMTLIIVIGVVVCLALIVTLLVIFILTGRKFDE